MRRADASRDLPRGRARAWPTLALLAWLASCGHDDAPADPKALLPTSEAEVVRWNAWRQRNEGTHDLRGIDLEGFAFAAADLSDLDLREATLSGAQLAGTVLDGTRLKGADLEGANFRGASLTNADLRWADLQTVDLHGADLSGADLRAADLTGVELHGVDLGQADLRGALLHGADLSQTDLSDTDLRGAIADTATRWPPGFRYYRAQVRVERGARRRSSPGRGGQPRSTGKKGEVVVPERRTKGSQPSPDQTR